MASFKKMKPTEFAPIFVDMVTIYENNKSELGITGDDMTESTAARDNLTSAIADNQVKKDAFEASEAALKDAHFAAAEIADSRNAMIKANKKISNPIKESLNISTSLSIPATSPLSAPIELTVVGFDNGINKLKWKRNGNTQSTQFILEQRIGDAGAWQFLDTLTATRYEHTGQTPGTKIYYRITAKRSSQSSGHSNIAVVYG